MAYPDLIVDPSETRAIMGRKAEAYPIEGAEEAPTALAMAGAEIEETTVQKLKRWANPAELPNICDELDESVLSEIGMRVVEEYRIDDTSRSEWKEKAEKAMELTMQRTKEKTYPWPKASNVIFPTMTEASNQFAARAYAGIIPDATIVKGKVYGADDGVAVEDPINQGQPMMHPDTGKPMWIVEPGARAAAANRTAEYMSFQLLEEQPEWESDTDKMLHILPIIGCYFRKSYFDPDLGRNVSQAVSGLKVIINYWATSIYLAPRISEEMRLYPYEIEEKIRSGYFRDVQLGAAMDGGMDKSAPHTFIEQHRRIDLDQDGYEEPYIVIVHRDTNTVVRITARFDPEGIETDETEEMILRIQPVHYYTQYDFLPNKEGGLYGQGFAQLLMPLNEAINTTINMMIDAGHLQNTGGGFMGKSLSMHSGSLRVSPGHFTPVNASGKDIREAIVQFEWPGPSAALFQLLGLLIEASKDVSSVKDVLAGDVKAQTMSPTVFLAMVEQGVQVFSAIYKRIHRSLRDEFDKLYRLNRIYLEESKVYQHGDVSKTITRDDFKMGWGVQPVSDPKMVADAVRIARAEFLAQYKDDPMFDGMEIRRRILEAAHIEKPEKLLTGKPAPNPEVAIKMVEFQLKAIEVKANAIKALAAAFEHIAKADALVMEDFRMWQAQNLQAMRNQIDALNITGDGSGGAPGGSGAVPDAMGAMEAPPGNPGADGLPSPVPSQATPGASGSVGA